MPFWKWWTIFVITIIAFIIGEHFLGIQHYLFVIDISKISLLILVLFAATSLYVGKLTFMNQFAYHDYPKTDFLWFISNQLQNLGLLGTIVGFIFVLTTVFQNFDSVTASEIKVLISELAKGMGIALITTFTGLITSMNLQLQLMLLENEKKL